MPEYLHPGVYVTEIATGAKPIEGVSTSTTGFMDVIAMLQPLVRRIAPEWTDHNIHDPGVTLLRLFAWLTESLIYRSGELSEQGKVHAARLAAAALALVADCEQPNGSVLKKVRFFEGRRLDEDDLRTEQQYLRPRYD